MTEAVSLDFNLLQKTHDRSAFDCGEESLNEYLLKRSGQELRRNIAFPYMMTLKGQNQVCGYYTLSASSVQANQLPPEIAKITRYDYLPSVLIGRLALDKTLQGKGYGQYLLIDALRRISRSRDFAVTLILVEAKDQKAEDFYKHFGFMNLDSKQRTLFIPFKSIKDLWGITIMDIEKIAEEMAAAIMKKSGQRNDDLKKSTIPIKRVHLQSDEFKEGVKNFRHVQAMHALVEEHEPDAYLDHILFLRCTDQITDSDARKVSNEYIKTGVTREFGNYCTLKG